MEEKILMLGDEAVALGAIHAGISGVYAYPGTPSTDVTEYIQNSALARERKIRSRWCTNEKTAMEAALGMSFAGKRVLVCMKHVGMNVCADAFVNSAITGINGGLVVLAADDPSMHSSQNEQDSRFYGEFAMLPIFEPSDQQECYDVMKVAFDFSEKMKLPVMLRIVTRLAHSRSAVRTGEILEQKPLSPDRDSERWVLHPRVSKIQYAALIEKQQLLEKASSESQFSGFRSNEKKGGMGIIACGIGYNYVMESGAENVLKISQYPLPKDKIKELASRCDSILVVEDGQPVVEREIPALLGAQYKVEGRLSGALPRTGELNPDFVASALGKKVERAFNPSANVVRRPPQLCQGCGHRDVYTALKKIMAEYPDSRVFGDIGCYTIGALPPFEALDSCVEMGASITMAKGAADAGVWPAVAVIGDSTFTHSGMTGLLDAVNENANITIIISDNLTTAMTGGQDSAGTNKFEQICLGIGVDPDHIKVVVPLPKNIPAIEELIRQEIEYRGVSVIIPRRDCMRVAAHNARKAKVDIEEGKK